MAMNFDKESFHGHHLGGVHIHEQLFGGSLIMAHIERRDHTHHPIAGSRTCQAGLPKDVESLQPGERCRQEANHGDAVQIVHLSGQVNMRARNVESEPEKKDPGLCLKGNAKRNRQPSLGNSKGQTCVSLFHVALSSLSTEQTKRNIVGEATESDLLGPRDKFGMPKELLLQQAGQKDCPGNHEKPKATQERFGGTLRA